VLEDREALINTLSSRWEVHETKEVDKEGGNFQFTLVYPSESKETLGDSPESKETSVVDMNGTILGLVRARLLTGGASYIFGPAADPALPLTLAGRPLVENALETLKSNGAVKIKGWCRIQGLSQWILEEQAWETVDQQFLAEIGHPDEDAAEMAGAVEAIARGQPRPGHSVLGIGTFNAARPAWEALADGYTQIQSWDPNSEISLFKSCGATLIGVQWMHDKSPEAIRESGGCTVSFEF